jgi:hypothetical protein
MTLLVEATKGYEVMEVDCNSYRRPDPDCPRDCNCMTDSYN